MKHKSIKYFAICLAVTALPAIFAPAQEQKTPEQKEKELRENIGKQLDQMTENLNLEEWQVFYMDSIMVHDYHGLSEELESLQKSGVENLNLYQHAQDKWAEKIYTAFRKVLNDQQWAKYLKSGAAREKKMRDKRAAAADSKQ